MKNMLMLAFIIFEGWKFYTDNKVKASKPEPQQVTHITASKRAIKATQPKLQFSCDGIQHCS